jgi:hypothetical protein
MASICDGTTRRGTRNCESRSRWLLRVTGEGGHFVSACDRHLAQVGRDLLNGESGELEVRNLRTDEH